MCQITSNAIKRNYDVIKGFGNALSFIFSSKEGLQEGLNVRRFIALKNYCHSTLLMYFETMIFSFNLFCLG